MRLASQFYVSNVKSTFHGTESLSYVRPKIWHIVPEELKELSNISASKKTIKMWKTQNCSADFVMKS